MNMENVDLNQLKYPRYLIEKMKPRKLRTSWRLIKPLQLKRFLYKEGEDEDWVGIIYSKTDTQEEANY